MWILLAFMLDYMWHGGAVIFNMSICPSHLKSTRLIAFAKFNTAIMGKKINVIYSGRVIPHRGSSTSQAIHYIKTAHKSCITQCIFLLLLTLSTQDFNGHSSKNDKIQRCLRRPGARKWCQIRCRFTVL